MSTTTTAAPVPGATPAEVPRARVAVMVAHYQIDVVLPTEFSVETFIDDLLRVLAAAIDDKTVDFTPMNGQWSLARPGGTPIPRWRTLADHDVVDGALLLLATVESPEVFTPVVEDITDALALINEREFAEFDSETATLTGLTVFGLGAGAVAALLMWSWTSTGSALWCGVPALLLGIACWVIALVAERRRRPPREGLVLALSAIGLLFAGAAMMVPPPYGHAGPFTAANLTAGTAVAAIVGAALLRSTRFGTAALLAVTTLGSVLALATGVMMLCDLSTRQVAAGVVLTGLVLLTAAPRLATLAGRIRPPDLPDPGREVAAGSLADIFDAESTPGEEDPEIPAPQRPSAGIEIRARAAVQSLRGFITTLSVLLAGAAVITLATTRGGVREIVMAAAVSGLLILRARWFPDRVQATMLIGAGAVAIVGIGALLVDAADTGTSRTIIALIIAIVAVAGCAAAMKLPGRRLSPIVRRLIDLGEYLLILVVPVLACWIMGIYTAMRRI